MPINVPYPEGFHKTITLPIGVPFAGQHYRDCVVGPETRETEELAYDSFRTFVDVGLAHEAYVYDHYEEYRKGWDPVRQGKMPNKPALTPDQLNLGRRYWVIWRKAAALARVAKIGPIPETEVVHVAMRLTQDDVTAIVEAATEVDEVVGKFRAQNRALDKGAVGSIVGGGEFV